MNNKIILKPLSEIPVAELIKAAERHYRKHDQRFADGLQHAAEIAASGGWQHIAPAWIKCIPNP
jgi:hypothetical protein